MGRSLSGSGVVAAAVRAPCPPSVYRATRFPATQTEEMDFVLAMSSP
jgi:hypothetical protein